jgi:hypothetical protein
VKPAKAAVSSANAKKGRPLLGPLHPWRSCPNGAHWVREYDKNVKVSEAHPSGLSGEEAVSGFKAVTPKSRLKKKAARGKKLISRFDSFYARLKEETE